MSKPEYGDCGVETQDSWARRKHAEQMEKESELTQLKLTQKSYSRQLKMQQDQIHSQQIELDRLAAIADMTATVEEENKRLRKVVINAARVTCAGPYVEYRFNELNKYLRDVLNESHILPSEAASSPPEAAQSDRTTSPASGP